MRYTNYADLGGQLGFGAVTPDPSCAMFHASWEKRIHAITIAMGSTGSWNLDRMRSARETLVNYRNLSYYEIWLSALIDMLLAKDLVSADELAAGRSLRPAAPIQHVLGPAQMMKLLATGSPTELPAAAPALYACGQRVRARGPQSTHHSRLPAYVRGRSGVIERVIGVHVFPDSHAQDQGENPQWLFTVVFDARELWGAEVSFDDCVSVDAWQPYLEAM